MGALKGWQSAGAYSIPKWSLDSTCYMSLEEHLNGNTQAITFLSRSLNTNLTCILIDLPMYLMGAVKAQGRVSPPNG